MPEQRETHSQEPAHRRMSRKGFLDFAKICIGAGLAGPLLTACGEASPLVTPDATAIPPGVTATQPATATSRPAETPTIGFAKEEPVAYVEPTLEDIEVRLNAGGSDREALLAAIGTDREIADEKVKLYDVAADVWLKASGYDPSKVTREYSMNGLPGDDFRWVIWHRDEKGNILWAQDTFGKYNRIPTATPVDELTGIPRADINYKAVPLSETAASDTVMFKDENKVHPVAVRDPLKIGEDTPDGKQYWFHWFNSDKGEWVDVIAAEAMIPKYYEGVASKEAFTRVTWEQYLLVMQHLKAHPQLNSSPSEEYHVREYSTGLLNGVQMTCIYKESGMIRTSLAIIDPNGKEDNKIFVWEFRDPDGKHKFLGGYFDGLMTQFPERNHKRMQEAEKGDWILMEMYMDITDLKDRDSMNPYPLQLTVDASDTQKAAYKEFKETGIIPEVFSKMVVWTGALQRR